MVTQAELGKRLADARLRTELTQEAVADALRVPRSAVSQFESGNRQVTSLELVELARLYRVDIRDLVEGRNPTAEVMALFRGRRGVGDQDVDEAVADVLPICQAVSDIEDELEHANPATAVRRPQAYPIRAIDGTPRSQGQSLAQLERSRLGIGASPIDDLSHLLLHNGLIVAEHALPDSVSGVFLSVRSGRAFVLVHEDESFGRRRFSLAHEYCHALVDSHDGVVVSRAGASTGRELRANAFASAFLVPKEGILELLSREGVTRESLDFRHAAKLAARFMVSYDAAVVALDQADLLTPAKREEIEALGRNARGYMHTALRVREPQYSRTTLREWGFQRTIRALELGLITLRKGTEIAAQLGYEPEVVRQNLAILAPEAEP